MEKVEFKNGLSVGELKKWIEEHNVSDDAIILMQRIEDRYFSGVHKNDQDEIVHKSAGWKTIKKGGYWYQRLLKHNKKIDSGEFLDKEKYPLLIESELKKYSQEDLDKVMEEYYQCQSPVGYSDEGDGKYLYLDAHY